MKTKSPPQINWRLWPIKAALVFIAFVLVSAIFTYFWTFGLVYKHSGGPWIRLFSPAWVASWFILRELFPLAVFLLLLFGIASVVLGLTLVLVFAFEEKIPEAPPTGPITPPCVATFEFKSEERVPLRDTIPESREIVAFDGTPFGELDLGVAASFGNALVAAFELTLLQQGAQLFKRPTQLRHLVIVSRDALKDPARLDWEEDIRVGVNWEKTGPDFLDPHLLVLFGVEGASGELETDHFKAVVEITTCKYLGNSSEFFDRLVVKVTLVEKQ